MGSAETTILACARIGRLDEGGALLEHLEKWAIEALAQKIGECDVGG